MKKRSRVFFPCFCLQLQQGNTSKTRLQISLNQGKPTQPVKMKNHPNDIKKCKQASMSTKSPPPLLNPNAPFKISLPRIFRCVNSFPPEFRWRRVEGDNMGGGRLEAKEEEMEVLVLLCCSPLAYFYYKGRGGRVKKNGRHSPTVPNL